MIERLGQDITAQLRRLGPPAVIGELVRAWPAAVGDAIARNAWPSHVGRDGTLYVATSSSAWAFELTQLAPELLARLRAAAGGAAPPALRFVPGRVPEPPAPAATTGGAARPAPGKRERDRAAELTASIQDPELRSLVARAAAASLVGAPSGRSV